ncbi:MAG: o-succinylbenzoate synthase [Caldithrix sp.]|nr:o-succinylbenzoate synthase [Caldithrix sp.]
MDTLNITDINIFRFAIPLNKPLTVTGERLSFRRGYIVQIIACNGLQGLGEISPLPGLHRETPEECLTEIVNATKAMRQHPVAATEPDQCSTYMDTILPAGPKVPSVRFGLEQALSDLYARTNDILLFAKPGGIVRKFVYVNALITSEPSALLQTVDDRIREGYVSLKIKVGRYPIREESARLNRILAHIDSPITIRLDANKSWTLQEACTFFRNIERISAIEYVEEPLQENTYLADFYQHTRIPYALDESLQDQNRTEDFISPGLKAILIKPSVLGSLKTIRSFIDFAEKNRLETVISDTFSSGIGLYGAACLAASVPEADTAAGLDTYRNLDEDILVQPLVYDRGSFNLDENRKRYGQLNPEKLEKIDV